MMTDADVRLALSEVAYPGLRRDIVSLGMVGAMFSALAVPVLGVVENMSHATCACGQQSHPFGSGGGVRLARDAGVPLLGQLPFEQGMVDDADRGAPFMLEAPESDAATVMRAIVEQLLKALHFEEVLAEGVA